MRLRSEEFGIFRGEKRVGVVWQKLSLEVEEMRADERFQK